MPSYYPQRLTANFIISDEETIFKVTQNTVPRVQLSITWYIVIDYEMTECRISKFMIFGTFKFCTTLLTVWNRAAVIVVISTTFLTGTNYNLGHSLCFFNFVFAISQFLQNMVFGVVYDAANKLTQLWQYFTHLDKTDVWIYLLVTL